MNTELALAALSNITVLVCSESLVLLMIPEAMQQVHMKLARINKP